MVRTDVVRVQTATRVELLTALASNGLQPQHFVRNASTWPAVRTAASDVRKLTELVRRRRHPDPPPSLEKLWAEAVYEDVRCRVLPNAPSRLDCLYAVEVGYDVYAILSELGLSASTFAPSGLPTSGPMIIPAETQGRWVALDMHLFQTPPVLTPDAPTIRAALETLARAAEHYWAGAASSAPITELLCDGLHVDGWAGS